LEEMNVVLAVFLSKLDFMLPEGAEVKGYANAFFYQVKGDLHLILQDRK